MSLIWHVPRLCMCLYCIAMSSVYVHACVHSWLLLYSNWVHNFILAAFIATAVMLLGYMHASSFKYGNASSVHEAFAITIPRHQHVSAFIWHSTGFSPYSGTSLIRSGPLKSGHLHIQHTTWLANPWNQDSSIKWTPEMVPRMSGLERFHCHHNGVMYIHRNPNYLNPLYHLVNLY